MQMATSTSSGKNSELFDLARDTFLEDLQTPPKTPQSVSSLSTSVTWTTSNTGSFARSFGYGHQSKAESVNLVQQDSKGGHYYYFFNLHLVPDASKWESKIPWVAKWARQEHARLAQSMCLDFTPQIFVETTREGSWTSTIEDDIHDFYSFLVVGLDNLGQLFHSVGLTYGFVLDSILLLQSADVEVSSMVDKLSGLKDFPDLREVLMDYSYLAGAVLALNEVLHGCVSMLTGYNSFSVESAIAALESLISMPASNARTLHAAKAREASDYLSHCQQKMPRMQEKVLEVLLSGRWNHIIQFVPDLMIKDADNFSSRCRGLAGVVLAQKNVTAYISRLLLSALAYGENGPLIRNDGRRRVKNRDGKSVISKNVRSGIKRKAGASMNITKSVTRNDQKQTTKANEELSSPYQCSWSVSLMSLHMQVSKGFLQTRDANGILCVRPFMARDTVNLQHMLGAMKGDLGDFLDQAKFFSMGYLGSWRATKKTLGHNVKILRQQQVANQAGLLKITTCLDSLEKSMMDNEHRWKQRFCSI